MTIDDDAISTRRHHLRLLPARIPRPQTSELPHPRGRS